MLLDFAVVLLIFVVFLLGSILYVLIVITQNQTQISANRHVESNDILLALSSMHKVLLDKKYGNL